MPDSSSLFLCLISLRIISQKRNQFGLEELARFYIINGDDPMFSSLSRGGAEYDIFHLNFMNLFYPSAPA